jgi:hypothetical protein
MMYYYCTCSIAKELRMTVRKKVPQIANPQICGLQFFKYADLRFSEWHTSGIADL